MKYAKIFDSLWDGSMRGKSDIILVFVNLLTHADQEGIVDRHWQVIVDETGLTEQRVKDALLVLSSPDIETRTPDDEGRRIRLIDEHRDWGWMIVNHAKYRELCSHAQNAERQARFREKKAKVTHNRYATLCSVGVGVTVTVDISVKEKYIENELWAYNILVNDKAWIAQQERYNPGLDVKLTLEKAHIQYWATEAGWQNKKSSRSKSIDWQRTFQNAISTSMNKVWLPKEMQVRELPHAPEKKQSRSFLALEMADGLAKVTPDRLNMVITKAREKYDKDYGLDSNGKTVVDNAIEMMEAKQEAGK